MLLVFLVLVLALVVIDLFSAESIIRSAWSDFFGLRSQLRRFLDGLRIRGPGWNR